MISDFEKQSGSALCNYLLYLLCITSLQGKDEYVIVASQPINEGVLAIAIPSMIGSFTLQFLWCHLGHLIFLVSVRSCKSKSVTCVAQKSND